jgi:hypothetical protein
VYQATLSVTANRRNASAGDFAEMLAEKLRDLRGRNIAIKDGTVYFTGGVFRLVTNWNILVSITRGEVRINRSATQIEYRLIFTQAFVVWPLLCAITLIGSAMHRPPNFSATFFVAGMIALSVGLLIAGVATGLHEFDGFLRDCLQEAGFTVVGDRKGTWMWKWPGRMPH